MEFQQPHHAGTESATGGEGGDVADGRSKMFEEMGRQRLWLCKTTNEKEIRKAGTEDEKDEKEEKKGTGDGGTK